MLLPDTAFDPEGFLRDINQWSPDVAEQIAASENIQLEAAHWEILYLLRDYYAQFDSSPAMRALVKYSAQKLGKDKGTSLYLLKLFPGSPAKLGSKLAGLPKPDNCL
ncbi:TusE/DsrC/DsvC family sulfur relay protein [Parahaliea sp. F7430]|uniref:Sulfurtransferase n=1 Tax=Sediminihaliea albiluteola TaxID=2758564 RepID=A0A7W2TUJ4_9GAMM|nr:TusE/DsrC/DsvC family sulfur relay protein [Sediminihaliea albiluteola]MBA6412166.1 TusE/DsrC/DsvC family sulfur relay protein [Sediminihaliea albiluteola]